MLGHLGFVGWFVRRVVGVTNWTPGSLLDLEELLGVRLAADAYEDFSPDSSLDPRVQLR